jgi:phosphoserine phosphatase
MAVLPSIGTIVSFFYQLPHASMFTQSPTALLSDTQSYALCGYQSALALHSTQPLELTEAASFTLPQYKSGSVIRLFGAGLNWSAVAAVLQLLAQSSAVKCRLYRPHPALNGALELQTTQLEPKLQQQLAVMANELDIELVYLTTRPRLTLPGVLVMDMDSTAIQIECIDEIAKLAGVGEQVAAITRRAMNGELDFAQSLVARVAALQGAHEDILHQVLQSVPLMPGLVDLVEHLQAYNWRVAIASGGFTYFTAALQQRLKLTATFANVLEISDGQLTGKVLGDIVDADTKARVISLLATDYGIDEGQTVAIGDGANDIPMLQAAALGVAFHAKPMVQAQTKAAIRAGSLLQLLYLLD